MGQCKICQEETTEFICRSCIDSDAITECDSCNQDFTPGSASYKVKDRKITCSACIDDQADTKRVEAAKTLKFRTSPIDNYNECQQSLAEMIHDSRTELLIETLQDSVDPIELTHFFQSGQLEADNMVRVVMGNNHELSCIGLAIFTNQLSLLDELTQYEEVETYLENEAPTLLEELEHWENKLPAFEDAKEFLEDWV
tara:strand:+ start:24 stop:617 length:594 start_codon:yes stop_codon:yes gene_type:complete